MAKRKRRSYIIVFYGSQRQSNRYERQKAKLELKNGVEPEPKYNTGKFWVD